jgi:chemotaxis protein MotA
MLPLLGMVVVFCSVIGGFALENGKFAPLAQPSEGVIVCGAALGILLTATPLGLLKKTGQDVVRVFRGPPATTKALYLSTLVMLHALFEFARRQGAARLEDQLDDPEHSAVFRKHANTIRSAGVMAFICDSLRLTTMSKIAPGDLDLMLEQDMETRERELAAPAKTLAWLADALPGLGIISAVLGVVITMSSLHDLPKTIGHKMGSALVGTFLGIFLSYGFVGPLAAHLERLSEAELHYYQTLRAAIAAFAKGMPSAIALEFGRRAIPPGVRPGFAEMEAEFKQATPKAMAMPHR